jgi:hypothetical protein
MIIPRNNTDRADKMIVVILPAFVEPYVSTALFDRL